MSGNSFLYVDSEYLSNAAYHWGLTQGMKGAKIDYRKLIDAISPDVAKVYMAPSIDGAFAFAKFLTKSGYEVIRLEASSRDHRSTVIAAQMSLDINSDFMEHAPKKVTVITGNGALAPLCRVLNGHCERVIMGLQGSVSNSLRLQGADMETLVQMLYESRKR